MDCCETDTLAVIAVMDFCLKIRRKCSLARTLQEKAQVEVKGELPELLCLIYKRGKKLNLKVFSHITKRNRMSVLFSTLIAILENLHESSREEHMHKINGGP